MLRKEIDEENIQIENTILEKFKKLKSQDDFYKIKEEINTYFYKLKINRDLKSKLGYIYN
jgi:hypothetical protein